jgi:hypothetical protein
MEVLSTYDLFDGIDAMHHNIYIFDKFLLNNHS